MVRRDKPHIAHEFEDAICATEARKRKLSPAIIAEDREYLDIEKDQMAQYRGITKQDLE